MRLRTKLTLMLLLSSVVPLAIVVSFSYFNSQRALERAVESEADEIAARMERRVDEVSDQLDRQLPALAEIPPEIWLQSEEGDGLELRRRLGELLGERMALVDSLELVMDRPSLPSRMRVELEDLAKLEGLEDLESLDEVEEEVERVVQAAQALLAERGRAVAEQLRSGTPPPPALRHEDLRLEGLALPDGEAPLPGRMVGTPLRRGDEVVGHVRASLRLSEIFPAVVSETRREAGEIAFAVQADGTVLTLDGSDRERVQELIDDGHPGWVVASRQDRRSGVRYGIARPIQRSLDELRLTAARNFGYGLVVIGLCIGSILPIASRMSRSIEQLGDGAQRLARGDLTVRVPVRSKDEIGSLAQTFNRMASDLGDHQQRLLSQERERKEAELESRLLAAEHDRKSEELEEARRFQLSLLPARMPALRHFEIAVAMTTATEVGGDYYDFRALPDGRLLLAIGDATGHGAAAGTMVTVVKSLFVAARPEITPAVFLQESTETIKAMGLGRRAMSLCVASVAGRDLVLSAAGMPPAFLHRAARRETEELVLPGTPLGAMKGFPYREARLRLETGDTLLLITDGLPEQLDADGEPLGYERTRELFDGLAEEEPQTIVDALSRAAGLQEAPGDDATFLVLRCIAPTSGPSGIVPS
ncbi:MAG: SpoIIE family protein phosphatase [Acidobacteriota bacterium]